MQTNAELEEYARILLTLQTRDEAKTVLFNYIGVS
jgi:hypothetical protein